MRRAWRLAEFVAVFFGSAGLLVLLDVPGGPIPVLVAAAAVVVVALRRAPGFDRAALVRAVGLRRELPALGTGWVAAAVLMIAAVAVFDRGHLFGMPRQQPLLWLAVVVFYPLLSVGPQELIYRAFLLHRYAPVFGTGRRAAAASAVAFAAAHVIFGNAPAVLLTLAGGWLFARRYQRSRSLLTVAVEHAGYGVLIFTVGLGRLFWHGAAT